MPGDARDPLRPASETDLGGDAVHADQAWDDVEHALAGAPGYVGLELGAVIDQVSARSGCPERLLRVAVRGREPRRGLRRIAALEPEARRDPPGDVCVVERECALHPRAEDRDVVAEGACEPRHRVEVEQRGDDDALAALRGRDDRPGSVRRRHCKSPGARLEVLPGRVAEVEPVDADAETLPPEGHVTLLEGTCGLDLCRAPDPPVPGV